MVDIRAVCVGYPTSPRQTFRSIRAVELEDIFYDPPKVGTLQRWRREAPSTFEFVVRAFQVVTHPSSAPTYRAIQEKAQAESLRRMGHFQDTEEVWGAWDLTIEAASVLESSLIVLQTPASFTPTEAHQERLEAFLERAPRGSCQLAWEPYGVWDDEDVARICRKHRLIHVIDPLIRGPMAQECLSDLPTAVFRLRGVPGHRDRFNEADFLTLCQACLPYESAYCLLANPSRLHDTQAFMDFLSSIDLDDLDGDLDLDGGDFDDWEEDDWEEDDDGEGELNGEDDLGSGEGEPDEGDGDR